MPYVFKSVSWQRSPHTLRPSPFPFFFWRNRQKHILPLAVTAGVSCCLGVWKLEEESQASCSCLLCGHLLRSLKQQPNGRAVDARATLQSQRLWTYLVDLEENLIEVICCFSLSPVGATDLRKPNIKRHECRRRGCTATSGADLDFNAMASGGQAGSIAEAAAWLTADQTLNFETKKKGGGCIRGKQQHDGQTAGWLQRRLAVKKNWQCYKCCSSNSAKLNAASLRSVPTTGHWHLTPEVRLLNTILLYNSLTFLPATTPCFCSSTKLCRPAFFEQENSNLPGHRYTDLAAFPKISC